MTDNSGVVARSGWQGIQAWHGVLAAGVCVLTAASVTLVAHTADPATADTYVTSVRNAAVLLTNGHQSEAFVGERLPTGARLLTGQQGGAELSTAGRTVYVGALTTVDVLDGVHQRLRRGEVMVDSRKGPQLQLRTLAGSVESAAGALTRVETAAVLRLAVFEGDASITATDRQARTAVSALHQVQVPYGYLPGAVTPLALTDDRWETRLANNLVTADQDLNHLAADLGGAHGTALLNAAPASLRAGAAPGGDRGESALSVALAQAAKTGDSVEQNLSQVQDDRAAGGSWGVVAALVDARVTAVSALLDRALAPAGNAPTTVLANPPVTGLPGLLGPSSTPSPTTTRPSPTRPTATPTGTPTKPTPPPSPDAITGLVNTVLGVISPTPTATTQPTSLLGGLLGH